MASWSYALRRIRILFAVIADIGPIAQMGRRPGCGAPPRSYLTIRHRLLRLTSGRWASMRSGCLSGRSMSRPSRPTLGSLFDDLAHDPGANGAPALADREPKALVHGD